MKPSNLRIELSSINLLERCLLKSPFLSFNLSKHDKIPSWDGEVFIYNKPNSQSKDNLKKIQVQIKGHFKDTKLSKNIKYKIDIKDLKNYLNDSGVIYFVIYLSSFEHYKIYYSTLTPYELNLIIRSSSGRKSKYIDFMEFPEDNESDMLDVLLNFHEDNRLQASTVDKRYLSLSEAKNANLSIENLSFKINGLGLSQRTSFDFMFKNPVYLYAKQPGLDVFVPVDKAKITAAMERIERAVYLNDRLLYSKYFIIHEHGGYTLKIGNLEVKSDTNEINFTSCGNLTNRLIDLEFFISLIKKDNITIEKQPFILNIVDLSENEIEKIITLHKYLLDVEKLIQLLGINEELELDQFTDDDQSNLQVLVSALINEKKVNCDSDQSFLINDVKIGNLNIFVIAIRDVNGNYQLINFFDKNFIFYYTYESEGNKISTNPYIPLKKEELLRASNVSFVNIFDSIIESEINDIFLDRLNQFVLEMIKAYDETKNNEIYLTCINLLNWLIEVDSIHFQMYFFNKLQLFKRKRSLTHDEYEFLLDFKTNETSLVNLTKICILMDNLREAEHLFDNLTTIEQEVIKNSPIIYFWKKRAL